MNNRNMNVTFAKQINGGWSLVALNCQQYSTGSLQKTCKITGNPVIESAEGHDHVAQLQVRSQQLGDLFVEKLQRLYDECRMNLDNASHDWSENRSQANLLEFQAQCLAFAASCKSLGVLADQTIQEQNDVTETVRQQLAEEFASAIGGADRNRGNERTSINPMQLLAEIFGPGIQLIGVGSSAREIQERLKQVNAREAAGSQR